MFGRFRHYDWDAWSHTERVAVFTCAVGLAMVLVAAVAGR